MVRVFRDNGRDGLSFLVAQQIKYVPIGDKIELNLGVDPEVLFELIKLRASRDNLWMQVNGTNTFKQVGGDEQSRSSQPPWPAGTITDRVRPAGSQLHGQADRRRGPPHVPAATSCFAAQLEAENYTTTRRSSSATVAGRKADLLYESLSTRDATPSKTT